jgi:hypothetical protein
MLSFRVSQCTATLAVLLEAAGSVELPAVVAPPHCTLVVRTPAAINFQADQS